MRNKIASNFALLGLLMILVAFVGVLINGGTKIDLNDPQVDPQEVLAAVDSSLWYRCLPVAALGACFFVFGLVGSRVNYTATSTYPTYIKHLHTSTSEKE